jgi:hypothetical protein
LVSADWREREALAAATLRNCREALAAHGASLLDDLADGSPCGFAEWRHYPDGEVYDPDSHAQYFFHRHPRNAATAREIAGEFGHFHLFLRGEGMPAGVAPLVLPDTAVANAPAPSQSAPLKRGARDEVCHLVGVSVDERGEPLRLFTTNRWVTGETWYRADDAIRMLDRFMPGGDHPTPRLNRWLGALVCLFEPEITVLLRRRDKAIAEWRWRRSTDPFEDTRLEIASVCDIDLDARLTAIAERHQRPTPVANRPARLPRMAEGWGA